MGSQRVGHDWETELNWTEEPHMSEIKQYLSFYHRLISLRIISSRFTHLVAGVKFSFLFKAEWYSTEWIEHIWLIHSSIHGHLCYFHFLAMVNKCFHKYRYTSISSIPCINSFGSIPKTAESRGNSSFNFLRTHHTVSIASDICTILQAHQQCTRVPVSPPSHRAKKTFFRTITHT